MFYYKHHIGDYRRDTGHLSLLEHGVYRQLLDLYYAEQKPIPKETDWVMRRLSAKSECEKTAVLAVLSDFFTSEPDGWRHKRCDFEIETYGDKSEKNAKNGKLGGRPKKNGQINPEITQSVLNGNPNESEVNPNLLTNKPTNQLTNKPIKEKRVAAQSDYADLILSVDPKVFAEWLRVRKEKKATTTRTAIEGVIRQADIAGCTLEQAIRISVEESWAGFKASWLKDRGGGGNPTKNKQQALEDRNDAVLAEYLAEQRAKNGQ